MPGDERLTMNSLNAKLDSILKNQREIKTTVEKLNELPAKVAALESFKEEQIETNKLSEANMAAVKQRLAVLENQDKLRKENERKQRILKELYERRLNLLLHGSDDTAWESRKASKQHVLNFLKDVLKLQNVSDIVLVDVHRLPQNRINSSSAQPATHLSLIHI